MEVVDLIGRCPDCGTVRENTGGDYSICPKCQGKLHPKLTASDLAHNDLKQNRGMLATLPEAVVSVANAPFSPQRYIIDGNGVYRRERTLTEAETLYHRRKGNIVARCATLATGFGLFEAVDSTDADV